MALKINSDKDSECLGCTPKSNGVLIRDEVSNHTCSTENMESVPASMDEIIENIGTCGRYQYMQAFALSFLIVPMGYQMFIMYFTGHSPNWRCVNGTNLQCNITGEISPAEVDLFNSRCNMSRDSWEYVTPRNFSFITEFDLVCDKNIIAAFANSVMYIAWGIGSIPLGIAADYFGRTPVLFTSYLVILIFLLSSAFVTSVWQFIFLRAMIGLFLTGHGMPSFALGSEMVGIKFRSLIGNILLGFETIALLILTLQAYYTQEWRKLTIMCSAPYIGLIVLFWCIDESPRWLRSQGRLDKSTKIMKKMASINQRQYPTLKIVQCNDKKKSCGSFINLFCPAKQLKKTILLSFVWMITAMGLLGISLAAGDLSGNMYRDFALVSLIEFPAIPITVFLLEKLGRRKTSVACLLFAGIFCCMIAIFPQKSPQKVYPILRIVAGMASKLCIVIANGTFYVWTCELYPTSIRTQGLGFASFSARVGATPAPFLTESLKLINPSLPFILMGVLSILSGLTSFLLPETVGKPMLEFFDANKKDGPSCSNGITNTTCQVTDARDDIAGGNLYRTDEEDALIQSDK